MRDRQLKPDEEGRGRQNMHTAESPCLLGSRHSRLYMNCTAVSRGAGPVHQSISAAELPWWLPSTSRAVEKAAGLFWVLVLTSSRYEPGT